MCRLYPFSQNGFVFVSSVYPTPFPYTVKMSSYRTPYQRRNVWPDREAEKREAARKAEEEQKRRTEMNETNFPTLSTARPVNQREVLRGNHFANLAERWAVDEETERRAAEYRKLQEAADRREAERIMSHRVNLRRSHHEERHEEEYDQEELAPQPQQPALDDGGWTEVTHKKKRNPKRELTIEEMDERERRREQEERRDDEFNGHLFESNRHDHDRV